MAVFPADIGNFTAIVLCELVVTLARNGSIDLASLWRATQGDR
jgi:hypothetical protein